MESGESSRARVLGFLLEQGEPVTRPEVASACGLSRPTVFTAVQHLQEAGLVAETGQRVGTPGRSATLYQVAPTAGTLAAVDIGGSNVRVAITDLRGRSVAELREPTARPGGPAIVTQATQLVRRALDAHGQRADSLMQVAVSVPGVVDSDGRTVHFASNIDQTEAFDFRSPFEQATGVPVRLDNNVNLAALGERWQGVAQELGTFAVVAVGAGIGAGVIHDGTLLRGAHGAAGEVAFLPRRRETRRLDAAAHDEAGGLSLLQAARRHTGWLGSAPSSVEELFLRAAAGEEPAAALVEEECRRISVIIASICAVVDPEAIILTGGVGANDLLITRAGELTAEMVLFPPAVIRSGLGERASLVGAIQLAAQLARVTVMADLVD
jgi:glucokinase